MATTVPQNSGFSSVGRVVGHDGVDLLQATVTSISFIVYEKNTGTIIVTSTALTVSDVIFDTLQTSETIWPIDSTGYNFKHDVPITAVPSPQTLYVVEYLFTPTSGAVFVVQFEVFTDRTRIS